MTLDVGFICDKTRVFNDLKKKTIINAEPVPMGAKLLNPSPQDSVLNQIRQQDIEQSLRKLETDINEWKRLEQDKNKAFYSFDNDDIQIKENIQKQSQEIILQLQNLYNEMPLLNQCNVNNPLLNHVQKNILDGYNAKLKELSLDFMTIYQKYMENESQNDDERLDLDDPMSFDISMDSASNIEEIETGRGKKIQELSELAKQTSLQFIKLGQVIHSQNTIIDRIDDNIEQTYIHMTEGKKETERARYEESDTCFLIYVTITLIFIFIFGSIIISRKS